MSSEQQDLVKLIQKREPPSIQSKSEFYVLYELGLLGNRAKIWDSVEEIVESGWTGKVCIRSRRGIDRANVRYTVSIEELSSRIEALKRQGIKEEELSFNQSMPDKYLTIQGEIREYPPEQAPYLWFSTVKKPMNIALKEDSRVVTRLIARLLLERFVDSSSLSDIELLFDLYPFSVIEFSSYSINVGELPGRNTVIWEVRNY